MQNKRSLKQIIRDAAFGIMIAVIPAIPAIALNTDIKTQVREGWFNNPGHYADNFLIYEGDLMNPTSLRRAVASNQNPDYVDFTNNVEIFGKTLFSYNTQRRIPDPEILIKDLLEGKTRCITGDLSRDDSITTKGGTRYKVQDVGHDYIAYRKVE